MDDDDSARQDAYLRGKWERLLKDRNPVFDIAKALMMLWVVWGHLALYKVVEPVSSQYMLNAKIGVNMPVFFVIGGYLAYSTFMTADWSKLIARSVMFLWPQFAVAAVYGSVIALLGGNGAFSWVMGMWFLKTYAVVYILSALVFRLVDTDKKRWLIFLVCYAAMLFWPCRFRISWFGQVIHMFPYFVFGLMCLRKKIAYRDWRIACLCGAVFLIAVFAQGDSSANGMNFWKVNAYWKVVFFFWHECFTFFARTAVGISGSVFLLFVIDILLRIAPSLLKLSTFGMTTLGVYVIHEYPLCLLGRSNSIFPLPMWTHWFVTIAIFFVVHFVVRVLMWYRFSKTLFLGDETLLADVLRRTASLCSVK